MNRTLFVAGLLSLAAASAAAAPPNVVMIISDDQGWTDYSFMGHQQIETPHIDRLASQGALFTRAYVPSSLCRPSLMTLTTGLFTHQHKVTGNDPVPKTNRERMLKHIRAVPTLPGMLGEAGYRSFQTGKWWEGNYRTAGFTHGMSHGDPAKRGRHGDEGLKIGREGLKPIFDFIESRGDAPFLVWYAPMMPHSPHTPPERLFKKYERLVDSPHVARYYAMCEWFDETVGELLTYLDQHGLAENTLVAYVTDNGWIQNPDSRAYADRSKQSPYDGGLRTPIILRWPGKIEPARYDMPISSVDLAPTILRACGVDPAPEMPGVNLLDICNGSRVERDAVFGATFEHDIPDIDDPTAGLKYRWCVEGNWKLLLPRSFETPPELYDLSADPHETKNLATAHPEIVSRLAAKIDQWWPARPMLLETDPIVPTSKIELFGGKDLAHFHSWLTDAGLEDPRKVFTVEDGLLHISGDGLGYLVTNRAYRDYHLVAEFKWGERTWGKRVDRTRDTGFLVHCVGPDGNHGTWMASIEAPQIIEGGYGDFIVVPGKYADGTAVPMSLTANASQDRDGENVWTAGGAPVTIHRGRINWFGRDPDWEDVLGFRGKSDIAPQNGPWMRVEAIARGDRLTNIVNGVVVNEGYRVFPHAGKILLQTELAEAWFRKIELWPLDESPN